MDWTIHMCSNQAEGSVYTFTDQIIIPATHNAREFPCLQWIVEVEEEAWFVTWFGVDKAGLEYIFLYNSSFEVHLKT